ncbi:DUF2273 domain-containing protein [Salinibacterium sp. TMP30]|uniref:DUF2273 domain-containing protein n=1 Tax=Salinibacterium sp. TMP30 TaxID=3138237 RepID=UPI0031396CD9
MSGTTTGVLSGAILAFAILQFGFWGFLLVAVLMAIGGLVGRLASGQLDLRRIADAFRGRGSS